MSDSWGTAPPPPPGSQRPAPPGPSGYRPQRGSEPKRSSGAFRDTLILAVLGVAGVVGMVVWSGGDTVSTGNAVLNDSDAPEFTLPPALSLPEISTNGGVAAGVATVPQPTTGLGDPGSPEANAIASDALIAVLPVPNGGTELPPDGTGVRSWSFSGTDWEAVRNDYLGVLGGQGYVATFVAPLGAGGAIGESYTVADPSGTIVVHLDVAVLNGQVVIEVQR